MYSRLPSFVFGFHGCDKSIAESILSEPNKHLKKSENDYDWLGHGIYFWEHNPQRALEYAQESMKRPKSKIKEPAILGAVIDLGNCLNLLEQTNIDLLKASYHGYKEICEATKVKLPKNKDILGSTDLLLRNLDCAVLQHLHDLNENIVGNPKFDTVRGAFIEGNPLYPNAGFRSKNHIQICVRDTCMIKGYFRPMVSD